MRALMALLCLLPGTALSGTVFVFGDKGTASCGEFVAAAETSPLGQSLEGTENGVKMFSEKYVMLEFVRGFLTALNMSASSSHQVQTDLPALELWLKNYCTAHPTVRLVFAANLFYREQAKKWPAVPKQ